MISRISRPAFTSAFHPMRELAPDELDSLSVGRTDGPMERLLYDFSAFDPNREPRRPRVLIVGPRGSGKTTELRRLAAALGAGRAGAGAFLPVLLDVGIELKEGADSVVWLPRVLAALQEVRREWSEKVPAEIPTSLKAIGGGKWFAPLGPALRAVGALVVFAHPVVAAVAGEQAAAGMKALGAGVVGLAPAVDALRAQADASAHAPRTRKQLDALRDDLRSEAEALSQAAGREVVLLLDGFDKFRTADGVLTALSDMDVLVDLPLTLVLTGPTDLALDTRFGSQLVPGGFQSYPLPVLHVVDTAGQPDRAGARPLLDLFHKRWEAAALGPNPFSEEVLLDLARWSSGLPREFLRLVSNAFRSAAIDNRDTVTDDDVKSAVREARVLLEATLDSDGVAILQQALRTRLRPSHSRASELVYTNLLLSRLNGSAWYRPNELLIPLLSEAAAAEGAGA